AIIDGLQKSRGDVIILMDADLQYLPEDIPRLLKSLNYADVVNGRRVHRQDGMHREMESRIYNILIRLLFGVKLYDNNSGLKIFRRKALEDIIHILKPGWHRYLLVLLHKKGYRVIEKPIQHCRREYGKSKFTSPLKLIKGFSDLINVKTLKFKR
ncbi:MAG: glycosyltransferase, partial [Candidatus Baldrarchaeia archaeon]